MPGVSAAFLLLFSLYFVAAGRTPPQPDYPVWPDQFYIDFFTYVEKYGADWKAKGYLNYNWMQKAFKATYLDWCLPLFDDSSDKEFDNFTCSYVAINGNMYLVNDSSSSNWETADCCMFEKGLAAVQPDWIKNDQYNETKKMNGQLVDVWWFPGVDGMPCYGYWNVHGTNIPVQFFGLSSLGPTILEYFNFKPGSVPEITLPNSNCDKECVPPVKKAGQKNRLEKSNHGLKDLRLTWPDWPSC